MLKAILDRHYKLNLYIRVKYHGVKKIHGFSKIPIVMVLISHCMKLRNNQRISNETFLKTNDIIKNGLNFPEE